MSFKKCELCGANLDVGEACDCQAKTEGGFDEGNVQDILSAVCSEICKNICKYAAAMDERDQELLLWDKHCDGCVVTRKLM